MQTADFTEDPAHIGQYVLIIRRQQQMFELFKASLGTQSIAEDYRIHANIA